jgi:hypothetical protein
MGHGLMSTGIRDTAGIVPGPGCQPFGDDGLGVSCGSLFGAVINADLGDGNDSIGTAYAGAAVIHGGPGNDKIYGTEGDDQVYGDAGSDTVYGNGGNDFVDGGPGLDQIYGDFFYLDVGGNDTLNSRDGELDEVSCGMGVDVVTADTLDNVYVECEQVDRGAAPPPATTPPSGNQPPVTATLPTMTVGAAKRYVRRALAGWYRAWRKGSAKVVSKPRRISRVAVKFARVSVRYRGRTYRGWAQAKYYWKGDEVYIRTTGRLR